MKNENIDRRFRGSVRLVTWHLWRVGESTDIDVCLACAKERGMIGDPEEEFIRECISIDAAMDEPNCDADISEDTVHRLHMCAISLNTADSA